MKSSQRLFSVDERLGLVTARLDFQSPRSPSHVADCRFSARGNLYPPRSRSRRPAPCCLSSHSVLGY
eukprot:4326797-Pleurochrysis_carterae.AAC.1